MESPKYRPISTVLFEMKTCLSLEMRMKMMTKLLRCMTGKLRRQLARYHRLLRLRSHRDLISVSSTVQIPSRLIRSLTTIKVALGDITFDQMIHY